MAEAGVPEVEAEEEEEDEVEQAEDEPAVTESIPHLEEPHGVTCPICLMKFKNPRRLKCEHTFCRGCLQNLLDQNRDTGYISCLMCQEKSEITSGGIDDFDSAVYVYSMGEVYNVRDEQRTEGTRRGSRLVDQLKCSVCGGRGCTSCIRIMCSKCDRLTAAMVCKECEVYTCPSCWEEHGTDNPTHPPTLIDQAHREVQQLINSQQTSQAESTGLPQQQPVLQVEPAGQQLSSLVNATIPVIPQEVQELDASLVPKSDRRKSQVPPNFVLDEDTQEVFYNAHSCWKKIVPKCLLVLAGFISLTMLCVLLFVALVLSCFFLSLYDESAYALGGNTVIVTSSLQPFWYKDAIISSQNNNSQYQIDLFFNRCDQFETEDVVSFLHYYGSLSDFSTANSSVNLPTTATGEYSYLLPGSRLRFTLLVSADIKFSDCSIELELYDDYDQFTNRSGHRAIDSTCVQQADSSDGSPVIVDIDINRPGVYYPLLHLPPTASYVVNLTVTNIQYSLNNVQYMQTCSLVSQSQLLSCEFSVLQGNFAPLNPSYCIIANTTSVSPSLPPPFITLSIATTANYFQNLLCVLFLAPSPLYFPVLLLVWCCYKCIRSCVRKCYNKLTSKEYVTSNGGVDLDEL